MWTLKEPREYRVSAQALKSGDSSLDVLFLNICVGEPCVWNEVGDSCWLTEPVSERLKSIYGDD